jgi:hypothetical protein
MCRCRCIEMFVSLFIFLLCAYMYHVDHSLFVP